MAIIEPLVITLLFYYGEYMIQMNQIEIDLTVYVFVQLRKMYSMYRSLSFTLMRGECEYHEKHWISRNEAPQDELTLFI